MSDPIQLGDSQLPPAGPGNKVVGTLEESRVTRNSDGLITLIDGRKAEHFLKDLSFQRAEVYKSAKEAGTFSRKKTDACVGVVMDSRTGVVVEAITGKADDVIPPDQVHPTVAARDEGLPVRPAAFCANCERMLDGVDSSHGKFTGNPPTDENWIP